MTKLGPGAEVRAHCTFTIIIKQKKKKTLEVKKHGGGEDFFGAKNLVRSKTSSKFLIMFFKNICYIICR